MKLDEILTVEEAAARLHCSVQTVWRLIARGELRTKRVLARTVADAAEVEQLRQRRTRQHASEEPRR